MDKPGADKASFFYTVKAVLWSMLGIRAQQGHEEDVKRVKASHAIVVGIIATVLFILVVYSAVRLAISTLGS